MMMMFLSNSTAPKRSICCSLITLFHAVELFIASYGVKYGFYGWQLPSFWDFGHKIPNLFYHYTKTGERLNQHFPKFI